MASLGRRTRHDEVWPDLVFALGRETAGQLPEPLGSPVALGVMNYRGWRGAGPEADRTHDRYLERTVELAAGLRAAGYDVRLVLGDDVDLETAQAVEQRLNDPDVHVMESRGFDDTHRAVMDADVLIASRYHNIVTA